MSLFSQEAEAQVPSTGRRPLVYHVNPPGLPLLQALILGKRYKDECQRGKTERRGRNIEGGRERN